MRRWWFAHALLLAGFGGATPVDLSGRAWRSSGVPLEGGKVWLASGGDTAGVGTDGSWRLSFRSSLAGGGSTMGHTRLVGDRLEVVGATMAWMSWDVFDVLGRRASSGRWTASGASSGSGGPLGGRRLRRGWLRVRTESEERVIASAPSTPTTYLMADWFEDAAVDSLVVQDADGTRTSVPIGGWCRDGISLIQGGGWNPKVRYGTLVDPRDGRNYLTVTVGRQRWMAQNLAFEGEAPSWCPPTGGCGETGRFYSWRSAVSACPPDWRLPRRGDLDSLGSVLLRNKADVPGMGRLLKSREGWVNRGGGVDSLGLRLVPTGFRALDGSWHDRSETGSLWLGDTVGSDSAYLVSVEWSRSGLDVLKDRRTLGYGVRCVSP